LITRANAARSDGFAFEHNLALLIHHAHRGFFLRYVQPNRDFCAA
jgi:hypothetical protein